MAIEIGAPPVAKVDDDATQAALANLDATVAKDATLVTVAKETTLAAVRDNTAALRALVAELRDNQLRRTDPLPPGANELGTVRVTGTVATDEVDQDYGLAVKEGRAYFGGGKQDASSGAHAVLHLANPATSGKDVTIVAFTLGCDQNADVQYVNDADVSGGTVQTVHHSNHYYDGVPGYEAAAVLTRGTNLLTGGTAMSPVTRLAANEGTPPVRFPFVLPPGQTFAVRAISGLTAINLYATVFWYETVAAA